LLASFPGDRLLTEIVAGLGPAVELAIAQGGNLRLSRRDLRSGTLHGWGYCLRPVPTIAKQENMNNANEDGSHGGLEEVAPLGGRIQYDR